MPYTMHIHKHRFAAWAASRAASATKDCRFSAEIGRELLEHALALDLCNPDSLPDPNDFDKEHGEWRKKIIVEAKRRYVLPMTHGVAAKLINIYLKSAYVCCACGDKPNPKISAIHPPIDRTLLDELINQNIGNKKDFWSIARDWAWTKYDSDQYEEVIKEIKKLMLPNGDLWRIEEYWKGNQGGK